MISGVLRVSGLVFLCLAMYVLSLTGCGGNPFGIQASLGEEFRLSPGGSVTITGQDLRIRFEGVAEDSRCPEGVVCAWEGRVSCIVQLDHKGERGRTVLIQPGLIDDYARATYKGYLFELRVEPYPVAGETIPPGKYLLFLRVSKQSQ